METNIYYVCISVRHTGPTPFKRTKIVKEREEDAFYDVFRYKSSYLEANKLFSFEFICSLVLYIFASCSTLRQTIGRKM